jgi:hypothetical protein
MGRICDFSPFFVGQRESNGSVRYYAFSSLKDTIYAYTAYYRIFKNTKRNSITSFFYLCTLKRFIFKEWFGHSVPYYAFLTH